MTTRYFKVLPGTETSAIVSDVFKTREEKLAHIQDYLASIGSKRFMYDHTGAGGWVLVGYKGDKGIAGTRLDKKTDCYVPAIRTKEGKELKMLWKKMAVPGFFAATKFIGCPGQVLVGCSLKGTYFELYGEAYYFSFEEGEPWDISKEKYKAWKPSADVIEIRKSEFFKAQEDAGIAEDAE